MKFPFLIWNGANLCKQRGFYNFFLTWWCLDESLSHCCIVFSIYSLFNNRVFGQTCCLKNTKCHFIAKHRTYHHIIQNPDSLLQIWYAETSFLCHELEIEGQASWEGQGGFQEVHRESKKIGFLKISGSFRWHLNPITRVSGTFRGAFKAIEGVSGAFKVSYNGFRGRFGEFQAVLETPLNVSRCFRGTFPGRSKWVSGAIHGVSRAF